MGQPPAFLIFSNPFFTYHAYWLDTDTKKEQDRITILLIILLVIRQIWGQHDVPDLFCSSQNYELEILIARKKIEYIV